MFVKSSCCLSDVLAQKRLTTLTRGLPRFNECSSPFLHLVELRMGRAVITCVLQTSTAVEHSLSASKD